MACYIKPKHLIQYLFVEASFKKRSRKFGGSVPTIHKRNEPPNVLQEYLIQYITKTSCINSSLDTGPYLYRIYDIYFILQCFSTFRSKLVILNLRVSSRENTRGDVFGGVGSFFAHVIVVFEYLSLKS